MSNAWKVLGRAAGILSLVTGLLFVVYFWNLDRKLLNRLYKKIDEVFDSKK